MRRSAYITLAALAIATITSATGCVGPAITTEGARVVASEAPPPNYCEALGDVSGRAGGDVRGVVVNEAVVGLALNDARNAAGKLGGDYLYIGKPQLGITRMGTAGSASFGGRAYRCSKPGTTTLTSAN